MNADQLDEYITLCFSKEGVLGAYYVRRQVEWADAELQKLLGQKSSSLPDGRAPGQTVFCLT